MELVEGAVGAALLAASYTQEPAREKCAMTCNLQEPSHLEWTGNAESFAGNARWLENAR